PNIITRDDFPGQAQSEICLASLRVVCDSVGGIRAWAMVEP
ncbi:MAG: hypothetical protein ACI9C2_002416, partial [Gammaproteobacteria bacterium]